MLRIHSGGTRGDGPPAEVGRGWISAGCLRDGAARPGLQSDPRHEHHGCPTAHGGDDGIASIRKINAPQQPRLAVSPLPRSFYATKTHIDRLP